MARPRPVPPKRRVVVLSACSKAANSLSNLVGLDADAGVGDREAHAQRAIAVVNASHLHLNAAGVGELHRIAQQVEQRLRQPRRVAAQAVGHAAGVDRDGEALDARTFGHHRLGAAQHRAQREVGALEGQLARLDLRQVEDVVDHLRQVLRGVVDLVEPVGLRRARVVAPQQVRQADHRIHRRADLVAHVGQEGALGACGRLGLVARLDQLGVELLEPRLGPLDLADVGDQHEEAVHGAVARVGHVVRQRRQHLAGGRTRLELDPLRVAVQHIGRQAEQLAS